MSKRSRNVLALDLAKQTGFARTQDGAVYCWSGIYDDDLGRAALEFERHLKGLFRELGLFSVFAEDAISSPGRNALLRTHGMNVILRKVCAEFGISLTFVSPGTWRKHFIGRGRAPTELKTPYSRRKWLKQAVKDACASRGWSPANDDEADALGILSYAIAQGESDVSGRVDGKRHCNNNETSRSQAKAPIRRARKNSHLNAGKKNSVTTRLRIRGYRKRHQVCVEASA